MKARKMFDDNQAKSYKTICRAEKVLDKILEELENTECTFRYIFTTNDEGRIQILFLFPLSENSHLSFHYFIDRGHLIQCV